MPAQPRAASFLLGSSICLMLAACSGSGAGGGSTAVPLQDDFSGPACRFASLEGTTSRGHGCVDGEFRAWIDNDQESYDFVAASAGENYEDVVIEVDVRLVQGEDFSGAFVLCRGSQAGGDFYYFKLDHSGGAIGEYNGGEEQIVRFADLPPGSDPVAGVRLRAECLGSHMVLYVNDIPIVDVDDHSVARGDIGLGAGEGEFGLTEARFDNLVVSSP